MQQQNLNYYCPQDELDDELNIDLKKNFLAIWSRKALIIKVFVTVLLFFILLTFIIPKKYKIDADLYINKSNSSNMAEVNPYFISEVGTGSGMAALMAGGGSLTNELELMQSPLVIDKVIRENDIRVKKLYGIFKTKKYGQYVKADKFIKKLRIENKKGTNVVSISYKAKDKELAYGVVNSIITNYVALHKDLNTDKSNSDMAILQAEYDRAKADLDRKMNSVSGVPANTLSTAGGITAMSAFSKSAQKAMSNIQGQYIRGVKSEIALREDAEKVANLAKKLEWAKLVDNMSNSSNVIILKEPEHLQDYEQASPKLLMNIILGIIFGVLAAFLSFIYKEITDKKLSYSMLSNEIIYDINKDFINLKADLLANQNKKIAFILFEGIPDNIKFSLNEYNISYIKADLTNEFVNRAMQSDVLYNIVSINKTDSNIYKQIKSIYNKMNIKNIKDVLIKE